MKGSLFRVEMVKQWRRPRTYVAFGLATLVPVIIAISLKANPPQLPTGSGGDSGGPFGARRAANEALSFLATKNGLVVPVFALEVTSGFLLLILVALFAGDAVASEASWGNLRALLARPVARGRLLAVKLVSALLMAFLVTLTVVVVATIAGGVTFGWHPIDIPILGLHQSVGHTAANLGLATLYVFWGLTTVVALAFMVSTMTDAPAGAIFSAVGFFIIVRILDAVNALGSLRNVLPVHYAETWTNLFTSSNGGADLWKGALLQVPYIVGFLGVAWWWFRRKDILS